MSAILVLRQRDAVHLMTDGAAYEQPSGIMHSVDLKKCFAMPEISAAVACTGPATISGFFGYRLPEVGGQRHPAADPGRHAAQRATSRSVRRSVC